MMAKRKRKGEENNNFFISHDGRGKSDAKSTFAVRHEVRKVLMF